MVFGLFGVVAFVPVLRWVAAALAVVLAVRAGWWHLKERRRFTLDRYQVQARRNLAGRGWTGTAYFGWILGTTVMTQMVTPLVQALAALCASIGVPFGVAAGIGLGLARSFAPWSGAVTSTRPPPEHVLQRVLRSNRTLRSAGTAVSSLLLLCAALIGFRA
jgi:ABC-type phosphate transport system permease subunit